ncbi:MAG: hypothetical protein ACXABY_04290 [Candidatus Thorarchaeota archaeon]|jgi:hypothetical protein
MFTAEEFVQAYCETLAAEEPTAELFARLNLSEETAEDKNDVSWMKRQLEEAGVVLPKLARVKGVKRGKKKVRMPLDLDGDDVLAFNDQLQAALDGETVDAV